MKRMISLVFPLCLLAILFVAARNERGFAAAEPLAGKSSDANPQQLGPPWFDPAWDYRRSVVITNSGDTTLPYYQVLVKLTDPDLFSKARSDGADIRFTDTDGTTALDFWIESWNKQANLAYTWVRVSRVTQGDTVIYLYYGNPDAASTGDGNATFDAFDDNWDQFHGEGLIPDRLTPPSYRPYSPFVWTVIGGNPTASAGILSLADGSGIKSNATFQFQAVGMKANFGLNSTDEWIGFINGTNGPQALVSDNKPLNLTDMFLIDSANGSDFEYDLLSKIGGQNWHGAFHTYELRWESGKSSLNVDHGLPEITTTMPDRVPANPLPVTLYNDTTTNSSMQADWVYVRQYYDPEPVASVKGEQRLVELSIGITDTPDPVRKGIPITYQLTISNTSSIDAPGVVVTDTLPANVELMSVVPSQGNCQQGGIITCDLASIASDSMATVTIVVSATVEGPFINYASVGSPGYELDLSNNNAEEQTLADWTPPEVNWEKPVLKDGIFYSSGGKVVLEASASDIGGIGKVEFLLWDHRWGEGNPPPGRWVNLGMDNTYPYQVQFDSSILAINDPYQLFVVAVDQAGNASNPYDPLQRIFIERRLIVFIPLLRK